MPRCESSLLNSWTPATAEPVQRCRPEPSHVLEKVLDDGERDNAHVAVGRRTSDVAVAHHRVRMLCLHLGHIHLAAGRTEVELGLHQDETAVDWREVPLRQQRGMTSR